MCQPHAIAFVRFKDARYCVFHTPDNGCTYYIIYSMCATELCWGCRSKSEFTPLRVSRRHKTYHNICDHTRIATDRTTRFDDARYAKGVATVKTDQELLKGMRKYSRTAQKAWEAMSIPEDQCIDFEGTSAE